MPPAGTSVDPPASAADGELDRLSFKYKGNKYRATLGAGKRMEKAMRVVARKVGKEAGELVDMFREDVVDIRETN